MSIAPDDATLSDAGTDMLDDDDDQMLKIVVGVCAMDKKVRGFAVLRTCCVAVSYVLPVRRCPASP